MRKGRETGMETKQGKRKKRDEAEELISETVNT